ncbi:MAG: flagellar motor switch protein FliN [Lachnospiraceae bacterium]|uniref:flagellar motor switch protein FliN n=1 Tax=Candidatus Merdisoma sp. JLR.KK011 TaxID=3114299 RepID=UPI0014345590|nr:flagellar motor switch protein FliN [Lachnospiraceae bacterium]MCI9622794.1 flagellar motor switch protein FliN [Lachnospiraceae bacterium]GFI08150.1 flagellar motor switch protein FliN [Lachnospiraceae bacterium]
MSSEVLSALEIDAIGEILNISLGSSATAISNLLGTRVDITTPVVKVVTKEEFEMGRIEPAVGVEITYVAGLEGSNVMLLKRHDVKVIVEMMMGFEVSDEDFVLDEINISAVCEVMNQMMGASATALSEFFGKMVNISTPVSFELKNEQEFIEKYFTDDSPWVVVSFILKIADKLESEFFNVMPMNLAKSLVKGFLPEDYDAAPAPEPAPAAPAPAPASSGGVLSQEEIERLLNGGGAAEEPAPAPTPAAPAPAPASSGGVLSQEEIERLLSGGGAAEEPAPAPAPAAPAPAPAAAPVQPAPVPAAPAAAPVQAAASPEVAQMMQMQMQMMQQMMQQMMTMQQPQKKEAPAPKTINVQPTVQKNLHQDTVLDDEQEENMELIMGVPLDISVEIGRTQKRVRDILEFTKGSLIVLDKLAGEQVDLFVNGRCIAKGDVVVVEDNFGIRITEIMKPNILSLE